MYSASGPGSINGLGNIDGTINPAALNTPAAVHSSPLTSTPCCTAVSDGSIPAAAAATSPGSLHIPSPSLARGVKRGRSVDQYDEQHDGVEDDEQVRRKRGRPPKHPRPSGTTPTSSPLASQKQIRTPLPQPQTPQMSQRPPPIPNTPTSQSSPPSRTTPTKPVIKALPTVRDHTTDQLNKDGDEYIAKEFDPSGDNKVDDLGYLQDGRTYKCRTFRVHNRGQRLFMLATECARVLGYRDSYLLFNKNRSLYKIIASQEEKDDLISQDILPYSYRSRQIAIVTAKSMFRQFGSRVIVNGRRVRDDYWEGKARKQGFTEEDLAGEKRPGGAKAREAAEAANSTGSLPALGHGDVIYSNAAPPDGLIHTPGLPPGLATSLAPLPMINPAPVDDPRMREYSSMPRPRQELSGQPYNDRLSSSNTPDLLSQASLTTEFSKALNHQRGFRGRGLEDSWFKSRDLPASDQGLPSLSEQLEPNLSPSQTIQSPQLNSSAMLSATPIARQPPHSLTPHSSFPQPSMTPPMRGMLQGVRPDHLHHRTSTNTLASTNTSQASLYSYPQTQHMWNQVPNQPVGPAQYSHPLHPHQSPSPHLAPHQSPRHLGHPAPSPQMHPQPQNQNLVAVGYPNSTASAYPPMAAPRAAYSSPGGPNIYHTPQNALNMGMVTNATLPGWPSSSGPLPPSQQSQPGASHSGWPGAF
ncbi:hypothetical protein LOZ57_000221 [Ophidiomyces ophidiicola]|uniref:uncharacterized protein n=1 Tax=Ophidiomyces ophidiicola TaxID=1387563 RepID=UPI0020C3F384|nr:uncharacterized protein LOZ57_000221 [Ophidiomyces ophidiicola]KAI1953880.1 hypothetical protein LOZ57_000221 [Ophidiomyces ophidiicola]KAI2062703.1 hypothetical protein LOZ43_000463 [Ophidiomyces ophidiicola]